MWLLQQPGCGHMRKVLVRFKASQNYRIFLAVQKGTWWWGWRWIIRSLQAIAPPASLSLITEGDTKDANLKLFCKTCFYEIGRHIKNIDNIVFIWILAFCLRNKALQIQLKPFLFPPQSYHYFPLCPVVICVWDLYILMIIALIHSLSPMYSIPLLGASCNLFTYFQIDGHLGDKGKVGGMCD